MSDPHEARQGRRAALLATSALALACQGAAPAAWRPWTPIDDGVRPTLEEVFLEPPLLGTPPEASGLSADGGWLLLAWSPPTPRIAPGPGAEEPEDPEPELRLLAVLDPAASAHRGQALALLLGLEAIEVPAKEGAEGATSDAEEPAEPEEPTVDHWTWSRRGSLLAAASGPDVYLFDPSTGVVHHVLHAEELPAQEDVEAPPSPAKPLDVESLAFAADDATLRIGVDGELYSLELERADAGPSGIDDLTCHSTDVGPGWRRLQWSDDLRIAFGNRDLALPAEEDEGEEEVGEATTEEAEPDADETEALPPVQVWHVAEERGITLEGMADAEALEQARLSPDGRHVFGATFDREAEPDRTLVPDYLTERVTTRPGRRQLADGVPSPWRAWVWDTTRGTRVELFRAAAPELVAGPSSDSGNSGQTDSEGASWWLRSIGWAPQETPDAPARLALRRTSADFREREIWVWQAGGLRRVWFERDEGWVGGPATRARWNADGTRLLVGSEATTHNRNPGWCQLFAVDPANGATVQLTGYAGELKRFGPLADGGVLVEGSGTDLARRSVGRITRAAVLGEEPPAIHTYPLPAGWNENASASRDGGRVVASHEELVVPAELWTASASAAAQLTRTTPAAFEEVDWIRPVRVSVTSADGLRTVFAHVYLPPGTSLDGSGEPRATIVFVHGAGYLQNVTDSMTRYPLNALFHSRLARLGYSVVDVDYRGSAGYGQAFRTDVQYHLGGKDLDDIHSVLDDLVARGLVDPERVGLYGGSYGGFMTFMALFTAPDRWAVGAALRSVTDWRTYHPGYTQPRLGRPSTHAEAYERSSPIDLVDGLEDPVLVLHGMVDSNVFAQDSIRLIEAMIDRGKDFDAMLYPSQGHGFEDGPHWLDEYRRIERYLTGHLGPPLASAREVTP